MREKVEKEIKVDGIKFMNFRNYRINIDRNKESEKQKF